MQALQSDANKRVTTHSDVGNLCDTIVSGVDDEVIVRSVKNKWLNQRVKVLWTDKKWYKGTVVAYNKLDDKYDISYDNGNANYIRLPQPNVVLLGSKSPIQKKLSKISRATPQSNSRIKNNDKTSDLLLGFSIGDIGAAVSALRRDLNKKNETPKITRYKKGKTKKRKSLCVDSKNNYNSVKKRKKCNPGTQASFKIRSARKARSKHWTSNHYKYEPLDILGRKIRLCFVRQGKRRKYKTKIFPDRCPIFDRDDILKNQMQMYAAQRRFPHMNPQNYYPNPNNYNPNNAHTQYMMYQSYGKVNQSINNTDLYTRPMRHGSIVHPDYNPNHINMDSSFGVSNKPEFSSNVQVAIPKGISNGTAYATYNESNTSIMKDTRSCEGSRVRGSFTLVDGEVNRINYPPSLFSAAQGSLSPGSKEISPGSKEIMSSSNSNDNQEIMSSSNSNSNVKSEAQTSILHRSKIDNGTGTFETSKNHTIEKNKILSESSENVKTTGNNKNAENVSQNEEENQPNYPQLTALALFISKIAPKRGIHTAQSAARHILHQYALHWPDLLEDLSSIYDGPDAYKPLSELKATIRASNFEKLVC